MANRRQRTTFSTSRGQKGKLAQWIRKNKNTSTYRNILKRGMALYIHRLNKAMEEQFEGLQPRPKGKNGSTIRWRRWAIKNGEYVRGKKWGGRKNQIKSDATPSKGLYLSGKLKNIISSCKVEVIGTDVHIITPKYIDDFRKLDPTTSNISVHISEELRELGYSRKYRNPPPKFLGPNGEEYRLARARVMAELRRAAGVT